MARVNMSNLDRWIRLFVTAIAAILLYAGVLAGWPAIIAGFFGFAFLVSGLTGFCPLYLPLKINTSRLK